MTASLADDAESAHQHDQQCGTQMYKVCLTFLICQLLLASSQSARLTEVGLHLPNQVWHCICIWHICTAFLHSSLMRYLPTLLYRCVVLIYQCMQCTSAFGRYPCKHVPHLSAAHVIHLLPATIMQSQVACRCCQVFTAATVIVLVHICKLGRSK